MVGKTPALSDRLALANAIEDAGIERDKAEELAATVLDRIHDNAATKADLRLLHAEVVGMRSASTGVQDEIALLAHKADVHSVSVEAARVRDEVTALRGAMQTMERHLNARIERVEHRLLTRLGGLIVVMSGIILAALRYWPPGHSG
jgi:3-oxoacyl-ACP reductase-like protein